MIAAVGLEVIIHGLHADTPEQVANDVYLLLINKYGDRYISDVEVDIEWSAGVDEAVSNQLKPVRLVPND